MTDWTTAQYTGPGAAECEERRKRALEGQAQRAAGQEERIRRFIAGEAGDPESAMTVVSPKDANDKALKDNPQPDPKAAILAKLTAAKGKLAKLRRKAK